MKAKEFMWLAAAAFIGSTIAIVGVRTIDAYIAKTKAIKPAVTA